MKTSLPVSLGLTLISLNAFSQAIDSTDSNTSITGVAPTVSMPVVDDAVIYLNKITVSAVREATTIEKTAMSVIQVTKQQIDRQNATNLKTALMYEPGISIDDNGRSALSNVRIRGLGDERVMMLVDGAPIPSSYTFGSYLKTGRQYFDIDNFKTIEVIKGPSSTLYGSSALAGTIVMLTKDPVDYLINPDQKYGGEIKLGYNSDADAMMLALTGAVQLTDSLSAMIRYTDRRYSETENIGRGIGHTKTGTTRHTPNPEDNKMQNIATKWVFNPSEAHNFILSYENFREKNDAILLSQFDTKIGTNLITNMRTQDEQKRQQVTLRHEFDAETPLFDKGYWQVYWQKTTSDQRTDEVRDQPKSRTTAKRTVDRTRTSFFDNKTIGLETQFTKLIDFKNVTQEITYGLSLSEEKVSTLRLGDTINRTNNQSVETEIFPNQGFPDSKIRKVGLFIQDRIGLLDEKVEIIPALRYDQYRLNPAVGGAYMEANTGIKEPVSMRQGQLSKRLGLLFHPNSQHTLYLNYAEGFRAPSFSSVNTGFSNLQQGYTAIPNPNLKAETSQSYELGWHFQGDTVTSSVVGFYNFYDNFIEDLNNQGKDPVTKLTVYKSINLDKAEIYGAEAKLDVSLSNLFDWQDTVVVNGAIAYAKGKDKKNNQPLNSIDPLNGLLGITYERDEKFMVALKWRLFQAKKSKDLSDSLKDSGITGSPGYGKLDLVGEYAFTKNTRLNVGIYNITNQKYWDWGTRMSASDQNYAALRRTAQPGINAAISLNVTF